MANKPNDTGAKSTTSTLNSSWFKNTLKSLGSAGGAMIKDIMPATAETLGSATSSATDIVRSIRSSRTSVGNITKNLSNNQVIRSGQQFFKNAIDDLKSGKLYNTERDAMGGNEDLDPDSLFGDAEDVSFSDFGDEQPSQVNVVNQNIQQDGGMGAATLKAIEKSTEYNLQATKATVDTMVSISSSNMLGINRIGEEITNQLTAINSNLSALIEYNNTNMTKFIDASIGYYEQMSAKAAESNQSSDRVGMNDIYSSNGGLDFKNYAKFIKQNAKDFSESTMVGGALKMFLDNKDMLIGGLIANPIGTALQFGMKSILPEVTKKAAKALDDSIKDFIPVMLERIGNLDEITGPFSGISSFIAKTFGIKTERKEKFRLDKIDKGPVPYNGMANTTIVEIIPKHLREANSYLKTIAETLSGRFGDDAKGTETGFDWETGEFRDMNEIRKKFYDSLEDSTANIFRGSKFGQKMASQRELLKSEDDRKKYDEALTQLYGAMERHKGTLDFKNKDHMDELMAGINSSQNVKTLIQSYINHLQETADEAIGNAIATKSKATREKNRVMQDAENNAAEKNLRNFVNNGTYDQYIKEKYSGSGATQSSTQSTGGKAQVSLHGVVSNIYDLLSRGIYVKLRNFKDAPTGGTSTPPLNTSQTPPQTPSETPVQTAEEFKAQFNAQSGATATPMGEDENLDELSLRQRFGAKSEKKINMFKGVIDGIMAGNSDKAFDEMMNAMREKFHRAGEWLSEKFFTPMKKTLFGEKDEDGYKRGGIFEGIHNRMRESFFSLRRMINGKGYLTADGEKIEDANEDEMQNTVKGKLHGMLTFLKDGIKEKLFGKEADEETGEEGKEGILGKAKEKLKSGTNALIKGLVGWKKALFGGDEDENSEEDGKKIWESIKKKASDVLPTGLAGSVIGAGAGALAMGGILGTLVGGPVGGALLGLAGGIASRSDKFKDWLFGPEDQDGKRVGGVISEKTQDFIKDNGKYLAGGAALGLAKGVLFPGSGLLVNLVGGPLAGAVTGLGTSIILRSRMFQNFLFGNEDTGQKGLVNIVKGWFGKLGRKKDGDPSSGKLLGMAGIGMGVGALTGTAILNSGILGLSLGPMGPIGGALLGLGGAILAQKKNFKEWLFGTVDPDTGEKRLGIIGKFGDMLRVNVGIPLKNTFLNIKDKFASFMEDHVFTKFNHIIEPIGNAIFGSISKFTGKAIDSMAGIGDVIKENFLQPAVERLGKIIHPVVEVGRKALEAASSVAMTIIKAPINVLHAITSPIAQAMAKTAKAAVGVVTTAVNLAVVKPIKNLVVRPLVAATSLATTIISAPFKIVSRVASTIHDKVDHFVKHVSAFVTNLGNRFKDWLLHKNPVARALRGAVAKVKKFGARVKNTFKIMVKPLGDFVKSAITEVKNHMIKWVGKFFSFLNPINLIKGLYNLMRGRKKDQDKDPSKMGFIRQAWYLANPDVYGYETPTAEKLENMSERERRKWAERDRKMGFAHERWTDNRDGTTYEYTKDKKSVRVVYSNGKTDLISAAEFDKRFPKSERAKLMKKSVDENGNEVDAVLSHKVSGRWSKSEYDAKKDRKERENRAHDLRTIKKWVPNAEAKDTAEMRIIAQKNAEAKGKKITFRNANPFDDARIKEINERMGKASLDAEEATAKHTKDTVDAIDRIYYSMKFGFKPTDEEIAWYKNNKKTVDAKRSFFNGHDSVPEEYDAEAALGHGASQARTLNDPDYNDASRKEKKKANNRYSKVRQRVANRNFTKLGFFGGLKRNFRDVKNYITGGINQIWNGEIPNELKDEKTKTTTSHAQGGTATYPQVSAVAEDGPEYYQPAGSSRKYIKGEDGIMYMELRPGDTIHPNSAVQAGTSVGDMTELTDSELLGVHDTSKLTIDERILHELIGINQNMRLLSTVRTGFFGAPGGFTSEQLNEYLGGEETEEPELDEDGNPVEGSGYKTKNLSELYDRVKSGAGAIVDVIPGSGLVKRVAHGVGDVFGFGKTVFGAGFELGHNAFTATGHMFGHAKNAVGAVKDAVSPIMLPGVTEDGKTVGYGATVKPVTDSTSETEEERKAREDKENDAQAKVSELSAEARQAERAEAEEVEGDNLRDEERNSLLKKIGDKLGGFKDIFGSIFSKKGLIGAAIIGGGALLSKLAPILFKYGKIAISKIPSISEIKDKVVNIWHNLPTWDTVKATIMSVPTKAKELFGTVKDGVISAWDWVYDRWGDAIDTVKNWGIDTGQRIKDDAIYGWNNLGDGDRPIDALEDEAVRFTRIADEYGNIDNESEARAKVKWRGYSGWGNLAVNKFSKGKYNGLLSYGTNNNGIKGLWNRLKKPAKWGKKYNELQKEAAKKAEREAVEAATKNAATVADAAGKDGIRGGVVYAGASEGPLALPGVTSNGARVGYVENVAEKAAKDTVNDVDISMFKESEGWADLERKKGWSFSESKLNPKNWFSKTKSTVTEDGFSGLNLDDANLDMFKEKGATVAENVGKNAADDAAEGVSKAGAKKATQKAVEETAEALGAKAGTEDALWKKSIKLLEDGMTSVVEKVGTKVGSSRAVKGAKTGLKGIKSVIETCKPYFKKVVGKIGKVLGVTAALGATVVGLAGKEVTWITIGALNGLTGAQRLFRTDEVDTTMKIISTVIGGLLGTTVGSIIDIINELVVSVTGTDIISQLATIIYTAIMDFTGNKELSEKLRKGQDEFKSKFEKDKTTSLKQQYSTMMQAGLIDKSVTEEQFIQGAEEGKYGARIKSFADYNDEQHKNFAASMLDKAKGGLTNMKRTFIGETTTTYTDKSGNVYTDAGDGMWLVTNKDGKELGTVGQDAIPEDAAENVEKTEGVLVKVGKGLLKFLKPLISCLGTIVPVIASDAANMFGGDPAGIINNMPDIGEDTPGGGLSKAILFLTKGMMLPGSVAWWGIHKFIMPVLGHVVDGIAATVTGVVDSISNAAGAMIDGNLMKLWGGNWDAKSHGFDEGDGAGAGIGAGLAYAVDVGIRTILTPFTLMSAGLRLILAPIIGFSEGVGEDWDNCKDAMSKGWAAANDGHPGDVWDATFECHDDNILSPIFHAIHVISNVFATIWGAITWLPNRIGDFWDTITDWFTGDDDDRSNMVEAIEDDDRLVAKATVPTHAKGTKSAAGGLAIVGENGPEFVYNKESGTGYVVGKSGAELRNLNKGDMVVANDSLDRINITDRVTGDNASDASSVVTDLSDINSTITNNIQSDIRLSNETGAASLDEAKTLNATQESNLSETTEIKNILNSIYNMHARYYAQIDDETNRKYNYAANLLSLVTGDETHDDIQVSNISDFKVNRDKETNALLDLEAMTGNGTRRCTGGRGEDLEKVVNTATDKISPLVEKTDTSKILSVKDDPDRARYGKTITNLADVRSDDTGVYYSQNDPRWANIKLPTSDGEYDGATMATSGCGPTALATALSDINSSPDINPLSIAQFAVREGYRDSTGTNAGFIEPSAARYGVSTHETYRPSASSIERSLEKGNSVILLGKHTGGTDGVTPYTRAGHYIVANGMDNYGNIKIQDPRGSKYNITISPNTLAKETVSMWSFNNNNPALKRRRMMRKRYGGRGNEYLSWLQSDSRWGNMHLGESNATMSSAGCYVTTLAKLCMHTNCIAVDNFDPGWLCQYLSDANAFDKSTGDLTKPDNMTNLGLSKMSNKDLKGKSETYIKNECKKLIDQGYAIALWVKKDHVVAIVDIDENGTLIMSDPAQNAVTNVFEKYPASSMDELSYWKGAASPKKVDYEYKSEESTGVVATAKKIIEPIAEIGGAFAKLASAIFSAILTGNWDIDWDAVFADESDESAATPTTGDATPTGDKDKRKTYTMDMDYTASQINTAEDFDDGYWSYLKQIGFNDVGASVMTAYMHELSGLKTGVPKSFDFKDSHWKIDSGLPIHGFSKPFLPSVTDGEENNLFTNKTDKSGFRQGDKTYAFLVNSGMYGLNRFMHDAAEDDKGIPYGLLGWTGTELKKALYEYTFENGSDISDPKTQIGFIKDRLSVYDDSLYRAMTDSNGTDYTTMMRMMPDFIAEMTGQDANDIKTDNIHDLAMTYYNSFADGKITDAGIANLKPITSTKFDKWLKEADYIKLRGLINEVKGNRKVDIVDTIKDEWDRHDASYAKTHGYMTSSQFDELSTSIYDVYNKYDRKIPSDIMRQIYKNRDADEFELLSRYADINAMLPTVAEDEKSIANKIIENLSPNAEAIIPKHKLAENLYEKDMNYLYDLSHDGKTDGKKIHSVDLDSLSDYGLLDLYNVTDDYDLRKQIISKIKSNKYSKDSKVKERLITDSNYLPFDTAVAEGLGIKYPLYQIPNILRYIKRDINEAIYDDEAKIRAGIIGRYIQTFMHPVLGAIAGHLLYNNRTKYINQYSTDEYIKNVDNGTITPYILSKMGGENRYKWSTKTSAEDVRMSEQILNSDEFKRYVDDRRYAKLLSNLGPGMYKYINNKIYKKWRTMLFGKNEYNDINPEILSAIGEPSGTNSSLEYFTSNQVDNDIPDKHGSFNADILAYLDYPFGKYNRDYNTNKFDIRTLLNETRTDKPVEAPGLLGTFGHNTSPTKRDGSSGTSSSFGDSHSGASGKFGETAELSNTFGRRGSSSTNVGEGASGDGPNATTKSFGGSGDGVNDSSTYYSQNDPRWASTKFIKSDGTDDGATMSNTGCGPTVMADALSDATGLDINPLQTASLAQMMGDRDSTGVNWNFISDAARAYGLPSIQSTNPSREFIRNSINTGSPVVLSGYSNDSSSPYTSAGHYILATGMDIHGNVSISDPRGSSYSKTIPLSKLTKETGSAWLIGGRNKYNLSSRFTRHGNRHRGGRGNSDWRQWTQADPEWGPIHLGNSACTMASHGCAVMSCAKLIMLTNSASDSNFTPKTLVEYLNDNGGFGSEGDINWSVVPGLTFEGSSSFETLTESAIASRVSELMKEGYVVILECNDGNHWVPALRVDGDKITMSDHIAGKSDDFFKEYPAEYCGVYKWFKGVNSPINIGSGTTDSSASQADTDKMGKASSIVSKVANAIFRAGYTGDWDIDWEAELAEEQASNSTSSGATVTGDTSVRGSSDEERIFNWFKDNTSFTDAGIAGIMGNWYHESGLRPNNLEDEFNPGGRYSLGYTDEEYTNAINNGSYTRQQFISDGGANAGYVDRAGDSNGNVGAGYGLAQWTSSGRKANLWDATVGKNRNIDDLGGQLAFALSEMNSGSYQDTLDTLSSTTSPETAADVFLSDYEGVPNDSKKGSRMSVAREYYNKYHGGSGEGIESARGSAPTVKSVKYIDQASPKSSSTQSSDNTASQDSTTWLSSSTLSYEEQQYAHSNRAYSDDALKRMVQDVLVELKTISANSDNLTYLKDINSSMSDSHNLYVANNTTNNMVKNNSSKKVGQRASGPSHSEQMARRIAFGR